MSQSLGQHSELLSAFEAVMSMSDDRLRHLFSYQGDRATSADMKFISEVSQCSGEELVSRADRLRMTTFSLNRHLEAEMVTADRGIEPCIDSIESIVLHDYDSVKSMLSGWDLSPVRTEPFKALRMQNATIRSLLQNAQGLQDFMEIPQLMEQCIAASQYAEALALHDYFHRTVRKFSLASVELVQGLEREISAQKDALEVAIDLALSTKALKVQEINNLLLLNRLLFPTADLKAKFLSLRSAFYESRKPREGESSPAKFLKDSAEVMRVHLTDFLNQFRILFQQNGTQFDPDLSRFTLWQIKEFLDAVERTLPRLPSEAAFQTIAEVFQLASFIKVCQLNSRLNPVFHTFVVSHFDKQVTEAIETFKAELLLYNWRPFLALIPEEGPADAIIHLTRHKPIAVLYNDITGLLNDLRCFPMMSAKHRAVVAADQLAYAAFELLAQNPSAPAAELEVACANFCRILVRNLEKHLAAVFQSPVKFSYVRSHPRFVQDALESAYVPEILEPASVAPADEKPAVDDQVDSNHLVDEPLGPDNH